MKKILLYGAMLLTSNTTQAQLYFGSTTGVFIEKYNSETKEQMKSSGLFYMMPIGYEKQNWLMETQSGFYGLITTSLEAGRKFSISESVSFSLLSGVRMDMSPQFKQQCKMNACFYPEVTGRLLLGHFVLQGNVSKNLTFIGIGFMGFGNE